MVVDGQLSEVERFYYLNSINDEDEESQALSFNALVPEPENLADIEVGDWRNQNWGVTRDVEATVDISELSGPVHGSPSRIHITYTFDTPWKPPLKWLEAMQKLFPNLIFSLSYLEVGNNFVGTATTENGVIVNSPREIEPEDLHYIGSHFGHPDSNCEECGIEDFNEYHEDHGELTAINESQILERCVICRHQRGLDHSAECCQLCFNLFSA